MIFLNDCHWVNLPSGIKLSEPTTLMPPPASRLGMQFQLNCNKDFPTLQAGSSNRILSTFTDIGYLIYIIIRLFILIVLIPSFRKSLPFCLLFIINSTVVVTFTLKQMCFKWFSRERICILNKTVIIIIKKNTFCL